MSKKIRVFLCAFLTATNIITMFAPQVSVIAEEFEETEAIVAEETEETTETTETTESTETTETTETAPDTTEQETAVNDQEETSETDITDYVESDGTEETPDTMPELPAPEITPVPTPTVVPETDETLSQTVLDSTGATYNVKVSYGPETGLPEDAELVVSEIPSGDVYDEYYGQVTGVIEAGMITSVRFFDISIMKDGVVLEPAEGTSVKVTISLADSLSSDLSIVHLPDDADAEIISDLDVSSEEGTAITFDAEGFSAYAIVESTEAFTTINTFDEFLLNINRGFYIRNNAKGFFLTNLKADDNARKGIKKTKPDQQTPPADAVPYYFEKVEGTTNQFYIYCYKADGITRQYVYNGGNNSLTFSDAQTTAFTVTVNNGVVTINNGAWYWNMQGGDNGTRFCSYNNAGDNNNKLMLMYKNKPQGDPYGIDNKTYGLMSYTDGVYGKALMAEALTGTSLEALPMQVLSQKGNFTDKLFVPNDTDATMWTFHWTENQDYQVTANIGGVTNYLKIDNNGVYISDDPCTVTVTSGTGDNLGKIMLSSGDKAVVYSGSVSQGFIRGTKTSTNAWLNLVEKADLTSDYLMTYAANKISISDPSLGNEEEVTKVILYTRVWNDTSKRYEFYAVDHDGTLVRCYEEGDEIQWIGDRINTMLWDFIEYHNADGTPNYYYELYNEYSEKYICPRATGEEVFSSDVIGINLNGRRNGDYFSKIVAWDDPNYAYAGVKVSGNKIVSCLSTDPDIQDFYFATITDTLADDELHEVATLDHELYGITMRMVNFSQMIHPSNCDTSQEQYDVMGEATYTGNTSPRQGLLTTRLAEETDGQGNVAGYPTAINTDKSLYELFKDAVRVNNLFLESTHSASGYFVFDSTQNFAYLDQSTNKFTVYQELGTSNKTVKDSLQHGQFFPYNTIVPGSFSSKNPENIYSATLSKLPDTDPRKYERLYAVNEPDYFFGMELTTSFVQTPSGKDDWGHDIIYEFTGDDDFWLYVDGELVIDLGGIHSASSGSINYCTGEVVVNKKKTTLYQIFHDNYIGRGHTEEEAEVYLDDIFTTIDGHKIFKNYTSHEMKIYYMERGAGASNLHMRFNQSSVTPGSVILSKEVEGTNSSESMFAEFPFQVWYIPEYDPETQSRPDPILLTNDIDDPTTTVGIYYRGTNTLVPVNNNYIITDKYGTDVTYQDVYFIEPGREYEIRFPSDAMEYSIVECGNDPDIFDVVKINNTVTSGTEHAGDTVPEGATSSRLDYITSWEKVKTRPSVDYVNHVSQNGVMRNLTFSKILYNETGTELLYDDDQTFNFRLYFASEFDTEFTPANMYVYHVKDPQGRYCKWSSALQKFVPIRDDAVTFEDLTPAEQTSASFTTSMYGAISKIPAFYYVEIREILAGTKFKVEERNNELPDGYSYRQYMLFDEVRDPEHLDNPVEQTNENTPDNTPIEGTIDTQHDPFVAIKNRKGYGVRVTKVWADEDYVSERDSTYFAVCIDGVLQTDTIREMKFGNNSLYWFFEHLQSGTTLNDYHVHELEVTNPVVDSEGYVTHYDSYRIIEEDGTVELDGKLKGDTTSSKFIYKVHYDYASVQPNENVRVDSVINARAGVTIRKTDYAGADLANAVFTLVGPNNTIDLKYTSDSNGFVTTAYLKPNVDYVLTEIRTPNGYHRLVEEMILRVDADGVLTVNDGTHTHTGTGSEDGYTLDLDIAGSPVLTIKNISYAFTVYKKDAVTQEAVPGVVFALHRQKTVNGVTVVDFNPIDGYAQLITGDDGKVPKIDSQLPPGTYELREVQTPDSHQRLSLYVRFTVSDTGVITLGEVHPDIELVSHIDGDNLTYDLYIANHPNLIITKTVQGNMADPDEGFPFTVTLKDASNAPVTDQYMMLLAGNETTISFVNGNSAPIMLKDGQKAVIIGIPDNYSFTVTETDTKGYVVSRTVTVDGVTSASEKSATAEGTMPHCTRVDFTNTLNSILPTGVGSSFTMSLSILLALTAGFVVNLIFKFRRKRYE